MPFGGAHTENQTALILWRTEQVLRRDGWCQGRHHHSDGRHCIAGAIQTAAFELGHPRGALPSERGYDKFYAALNAVTAVVHWPAVGWNDTKGRTADQVIDAVHRAAVWAEANPQGKQTIRSRMARHLNKILSRAGG